MNYKHTHKHTDHMDPVKARRYELLDEMMFHIRHADRSIRCLIEAAEELPAEYECVRESLDTASNEIGAIEDQFYCELVCLEEDCLEERVS